MNPGLTLQKVGDLTWGVEATTGVAAYVWLSAPNGVTGIGIRMRFLWLRDKKFYFYCAGRG